MNYNNMILNVLVVVTLLAWFVATTVMVLLMIPVAILAAADWLDEWIGIPSDLIEKLTVEESK